MSRYINADKLIESLEHGSIVIDEKVFDCETIHDELVYLLDKVSDFVSKVVREQSTADVVEVVRCKDCRYRERRGGIFGHYVCTILGGRYARELPVDDRFFCYHGERKNDE